MSEQQNPAIQAALKETEEARQQAQKAAERFKSIEESQARKLPLTPKQTLPGRQAEEVKHKRVVIAPETGKPQTLRDVIRRRYGAGKPGRVKVVTVRQAPNVKNSRGSPVFVKGKIQESSGRISTELNPQKAERLAQLREYVRAFQNRKELSKLEQAWRRTRAQRTHDPELRP